MWRANLWDSRREAKQHKHTFIPQMEEDEETGQEIQKYNGGHGYAHVIICYAQTTQNDESGTFYFYHKRKEEYMFVEDEKTNCFEAIRMGFLQ